jgi:hypothetical protein
MNHIASIVFVLVAGCAAEGQGIDVPSDPTSTISKVPLRGPSGYDAGVAAPDTGVNIDLGTPGDTGSQAVDVLVVPDARVSLDGLPCMQQVVANGYASDRASCSTWNLKLTEPYNSQLPVPYTSQTACKALIDCYVVNSNACTNWHTQACSSCLGSLPISVNDWQPLINIITPFCLTFFQ